MIKNKKLIIFTILASMSTVLLTGCGNTSDKTLLAKVGKETIYLSDVEKELQFYIDSLIEEYGEDYENKIDDEIKEDLSDRRKDILDGLIDEAILINKAYELNLIPNDEEMLKLIDEQKESLIQYYGSEEALKEALAYFKYTEEYFNELMKNRVILNAVFEYIIKDASVTDEEISTYYNDHIDQFTVKPGAHAKHILFEDEESANKASQSIINRETTFDKLFEEYSENRASMTFPLAEDLDFVQFEEPNFDEDFLAGFKKLTEGQVSTPVKSSFGYHIIKATDFSQSTSIKTLDEVKEEIEHNLLHDKQDELYDSAITEWKNELNIKTYESKLEA